jgi:IS605 OrfB family transposase
MTITIETRIADDPAILPVLESCAALFSRLERLLFVALYARGETLNAAKRRFLTEHCITARHFNAIYKQLSAKVESWREVRKLNLATVSKQIVKTQKAIAKAKAPFVKHQKKRRLQKLRDRKAGIERDLAAPVPSVCFGSRKLFGQQHELAANGYADHAAWQKAWRASRSSSFFVLGSADETAGNQTCQYRDGALHLRLPDALGGETLVVPVAFRYRVADLLAALTPTKQTVTRGPRKGKAVTRHSAVSYRFLRRDNGHWYAQAMFEVAAAPITTSGRKGCAGIDTNPWGLAVTRCDRCGNPVDTLDIPWAVEGRSADQAKASIGDAVAVAVLYAEKHGVPVAVETLDFDDKKNEDRGARCNRMLSAFAYAAFAQMLRGRCAREGVELVEVNPAFTSVIGAAKFAAGYGLSVHRAAALAIARRALNFGEVLRTRHTGSALALPARNRTRHVWSDWRRWAKARRPQRKAPTKPKGSRGSKPPNGRQMPIPCHPTTAQVGGRAGRATPRRNAVPVECGATPQANGRHRCSDGLVSVNSHAPKCAVR